MTEEEAYQRFKAIRWAGTNGKPVCPHGCNTAVYEVRTRRIFTCKKCLRQFSITAGTIFSNPKLPMRDLLAAIAIFVNGAKGTSALQMSRLMGVGYKTAFVLAHKLREAMGAQIDTTPLAGNVEIDGAYYGGYLKPKNVAASQSDRRKKQYITKRRKVAVVLCERGGRTLAIAAGSEKLAVPQVKTLLAKGAILYTDEAKAWSPLDYHHDRHVIAHKHMYARGPVSTNHAESFHSRMRRSEIGVHHHIAGPYFAAYLSENAWRDNYKRVSNGDQYLALISAVANHPVSRQWKGYWQRRKPTEPQPSSVPKSRPDTTCSKPEADREGAGSGRHREAA